jgi:hypothetical protein
LPTSSEEPEVVVRGLPYTPPGLVEWVDVPDAAGSGLRVGQTVLVPLDPVAVRDPPTGKAVFVR